MADGYPAKVARYMAANPPPPTQVWACNWPAFEVFSALVTQWRMGYSGPVGLDYSAVRVVMDMHGIQDQRAMLDDIQAMEFEALKVFKERSKNG